MALRSRLLVLGALTLVAGVLSSAPRAAACGSSGYTYAGLASATRSHGVGARITAVGAPQVKSGHVAGWVGVGGPHEGPNGSDEWIQVGFSAFPGSLLSSLYYEVTRAGSTPRYVEVAHGLLPGVSRRVAVLEMASRPNWWRVWVNHRPASAPIFLPGSHGTWRGIATVESWGAGSNVCNGFGYRFDRIVVAQNPGGAWRELTGALPIRSGGYRMNVVSRASFVATSGKLLKPEVVRAELSATKPKPKPQPQPAPAPAPAPAEPQPAAPTSDPQPAAPAPAATEPAQDPQPTDDATAPAEPAYRNELAIP